MATAAQTVHPSRAGTLDEVQILQRKPSGFWRDTWRRFRADRGAMFFGTIFVLILIFVLSGPLISKYITHYTYSENHLAQKLSSPGENGFILGSDGNGRDVLTRLAYGGRISLLFALSAMISVLCLGGIVGGCAGFFGGWFDSVAMRIAEIVLAMPLLPLLILISSMYRPPVWQLAMFVGLFSWPGISRLIRGEVMSIRRREYIDAARVTGASNLRLLIRHVFPNVLPIILVWASLSVPSLILLEAILSYLGVGVRPPTPSWGNMLEEAKQFYRTSWWLIFIPGFAIYITVLSMTLTGNGVRDAIDVRLQRK
ncbi:MAG TPA: ABC transporter permease [Thermomicrobiales bacterium]|nr:ABC transporter permease [Thermomicrobiales bacterium]